MEQVKDVLLLLAGSGASPDPDIPYASFPEFYHSRRRDLANRLYHLLGISRENKKGREEWILQGNKFFDAPNGLIFYLDGELGPWSLFDLGVFSQSVMLASLAFGLGTCSSAVVVGYPQVLRGILGIPDEKKIVLGMAIGYPDWQHPANKLKSPREAVASFTQWRGF